MRSHGHVSLLIACSLSIPCAPAAMAAQAPTTSQTDARAGSLRGRAVDSSAAVLPGVMVTVVSGDGRTWGTTVTDGSGAFSFDSLPAGHLTLTFQLDGFLDAQVGVPVRSSGPSTDAPIVQRLELAALAEQVTVRPDPPPPPPPPPPVLAPVPQHDEASVCAPAKADAPVPSIGTVKAGMYEATKNLFAAGEEVVIEGGTLTGLRAGENYVVRRRYQTGLTSSAKVPIMGEHSSGIVQIVSADERMSSAVVVYTCDAMMMGDYLAPFEPEPIRRPDPAGRPAFEKAARVLFADAGQLVGVERRMVVIDQGSAHSVRPGQRVTLFRKSPAGQPTILGQAVVVTVRTDSATIRIDQARDVIFFGAKGDWAAPQLPPQVGQR